MIFILDTNYFISREIPTNYNSNDTIYTTSSVDLELKDKQSIDYRQIYSFLIIVKEPSEKYIQMVKEKIKNSLIFLSSTDIDVVALTLEISEEISNQWIDPNNIDELEIVKCLTKDNGMRNALSLLGLLNDQLYKDKKFKMRCFACFKIFDTKIDFCPSCGYSTITRVTVIDTDEGEKVMLSKNYNPKAKELKVHGIKILSEDQKEYAQYLKRNERIAKNQSKCNFYD
jgi:RNA-binding protein NOB1